MFPHQRNQARENPARLLASRIPVTLRLGTKYCVAEAAPKGQRFKHFEGGDSLGRPRNPDGKMRVWSKVLREVVSIHRKGIETKIPPIPRGRYTKIILPPWCNRQLRCQWRPVGLLHPRPLRGRRRSDSAVRRRYRVCRGRDPRSGAQTVDRDSDCKPTAYAEIGMPEH